MIKFNCRACKAELNTTVVNLYHSPLANSLLSVEQLLKAEKHYPLHVMVCPECYLVQVTETASPEEIFSDYLYFSSYSRSWLDHCQNYAQEMIEFCQLNKGKKVVEIACNDGYLLQFFKDKGISVLGVEPAENVAVEARKKGIDVCTDFFNAETAQSLREKGEEADLIAAKNVLAHVPDINSFVKGIKILLKKEGIFTIEFPHLLQLIKEGQFDTIYHEHFSYLSLIAVNKIFKDQGLNIFDVKEIPTHGGSLRIYGCHEENTSREISERVHKVLKKETDFGLTNLDTYKKFSETVKKIKLEFLEFLTNVNKNNKKIMAYGAPAKGNTFLNYCGVKGDFIEATVDLNPHKQGKFLPGSHIPVYGEDHIRKVKPDYILILPWNLKNEIRNQLSYVKEWGGKFVTAIPHLVVDE